MLNFKNIDVIIDETKLADKYREKVIQFFKSLDNKDYDAAYYAHASMNNVYDVVAIEKDHIFNCIPVRIFCDLVGIDCRDKEFSNIKSEFNLQTISRGELDAMIHDGKLYRETVDFFEKFKKESKVCEIIKSLTNGNELDLEVVSKDGDQIKPIKSLFINKEGLFALKTFTDLKSLVSGTREESTVSPQYALNLISEYIDKTIMDEARKEKERMIIAYMLQVCY